MTTFPVEGPVRLRVTLAAGRVEVEQGEDAVVEVAVTALRDDDASLEAVAGTTVTSVPRGGGHEIRVDVPRREGGFLARVRQPKVGVLVRSPAGADVFVDCSSADVDLRADCGAVEVKGSSGDVVAGRVRSLSVTSASGDVAVGSVAGELVVKTASGDVDARSVEGEVSVHSASGDVQLGSAHGPCVLRTVSGDVSIASLGRGGLRANAVSGDVDVAVEPGLRLWVDAQSISGSLRSDLELGDGAAEGEGDAVQLHVRTVSGDVRIARA